MDLFIGLFKLIPSTWWGYLISILFFVLWRLKGKELAGALAQHKPEPQPSYVTLEPVEPAVPTLKACPKRIRKIVKRHSMEMNQLVEANKQARAHAILHDLALDVLDDA